MASCTADLRAGATLHLGGWASGALPHTMGHSAGLPVADNQNTRRSASRVCACSAVLHVVALQCRSLAYLQQCWHAPEPYMGCPESCLGAIAAELPARHLCHTSGHVWLLNFCAFPVQAELGTALTECSMGSCMRAHLSSCAWRPGCTTSQAVWRAGSADTLLTLPGHSQPSHVGVPGNDVAATTVQPPPCLTVISPNNRPITSSVSVVRPCWAIVQNTSALKAKKVVLFTRLQDVRFSRMLCGSKMMLAASSPLIALTFRTHASVWQRQGAPLA